MEGEQRLEHTSPTAQDRAISTVVFQMWPQLALWALTGNCVKPLHVSHLLEQEMMTELASGTSDACPGF